MPEVRTRLRFILNDEDISLDALPATTTLLDWLRLEKRLRGSKEGCAEGDCGACTVLVGRLSGDELVYEAINACICFVGSLDGTHVVTIEHLSPPGGPLHPVQQAMVDHHGSQCGFCTPGFVMSLYALWMKTPAPDEAAIEHALQGNLCRCTGYAPIVRAGRAIAAYGGPDADPLVAERARIAARLATLRDGTRVEVGTGRNRIIVPADLSDFAAVYAQNPEATVVAGATDVGLWVTKFMRDIGPMIFAGHLPDLHRIEENAHLLTLYAGVTYTEAAPVIARRFPQMSELWARIAGDQIRNAGTIGGNVANGSPIGDTPPPLIALGARVTLRLGRERRSLPIEDFFLAYGKQDRRPGELVETITIPYLPEDDHFAVYKISKRRDEDISSVCGAFRVCLDGGGMVIGSRIAFGGMAATPKRAAKVEAALLGKPWSHETVEAAIPAFAEDYQPITDMRASADYRLLVAQNLLRRFFLETTGAGGRLVRRGRAA